MSKKYNSLFLHSKTIPSLLVLLGMGLVALLALTVLQNGQDVREKAAYVTCVAPSTEISSGQELGACQCPGGTVIEKGQNCPIAKSENPTSFPTINLQSGGVPTGACVPGDSKCIDSPQYSTQYTCTNSAGAWSSFTCTGRCNGKTCATPQNPIPTTPISIIGTGGPSNSSGSCTIGNTTCVGDLLYTCQDNKGTYSTKNCLGGCAAGRCLNYGTNIAQKVGGNNVTSGASPKDGTTSLNSSETKSGNTTGQQSLQLSGVCGTQGGIKSVAGCLNTSDMKYWCNDRNAYDIERCSTGAGTCKNSKCGGIDPLAGYLPTATPKPLPTQVVSSVISPTPEVAQLEGVCGGNGGIKSVAGCLNTSTMKYWCKDANTYDKEQCSTGAGTCRGKTCGGQDPLAGALPPQPQPTVSIAAKLSSPTPVSSSKPTVTISTSTNTSTAGKLVVDAQGVCSDNGGINTVAGCLDHSRMKYWCKDGGYDIEPCSTGIGSCGGKSCGGKDPLTIQVPVPVEGDVRSSQVLQTQYAELSSNGCGVVTICNINIQAGKDCNLDKIVADSGFKGYGMHMQPLMDTLNNSGLETEWLFSKQDEKGEVVADTIYQTISHLDPENKDAMKKTVENGNVLFALVVVINRDLDGTEHRTEHYVMIDHVDEEGNFTGVDPFFGQDRLVNKTGEVSTINFSQWGKDLIIENVAVVQMPDVI